MIATVDLKTTRRRTATYWIVGIGLMLGLQLGSDSSWRSSADLHTVMEVAATLLALVVGAMSLGRYYSKEESVFLFIGAGFLGTGFLDGYHTIVTSTYLKPLMHSSPASLIPWSWIASRLFLSIFMVLSWYFWVRGQRLGGGGHIPERAVYWGTAAFTLTIFLIFAFTPLPPAIYPDLFFHRPEEFVPALFFLIALIGYVRKGAWRNNIFEHWLVLSLIVGFVCQAAFMSHSGHLFDYEFDIAHLLKKLSYICVLIGLMGSMYVIFRRETLETLAEQQQRALNMALAEALEESHQRGEWLQAVVSSVLDGLIAIDTTGRMTLFNAAAERIFGYTAQEVMGRNVNMLMPEPFRSQHDQYLQHYLQTGVRRIIGIGREVSGLRKDGSVFPMNLSLTELRSGNDLGFIGLVRDIAEAKQAQETLRQALKQAEHASLLKSQFLATMSHEIRTPLTTILGTQELLFDTSLDDAQKSYLHLANDAGNTLLMLINDILDLSKVEAGKLELENHVFAPVSLIHEVVQLISVKAQEKKLALHSEIVPQVAPLIYGDSWRLRQVLLNLLANAVKFTQEGEIILRLTTAQTDPDKGLLFFEVIDTGIGIDEEIQKRLFQPFIQADPSDTRKYGGSGLGLAISKRLVELWGGQIGLESQVGKGCRFWFSFGQAVDDAKFGEASEVSVSQQPVSPAKAKVLLVEDSPANQAVLSSMLRSAHHQVDIVDNGASAIDAVQIKTYDLIIMDVSMPEMDGMESVRRIRALGGEAAKVPIVAMTGHAIKGYRERCLEAGMNDYAIKPISKKQLLALVDQWCNAVISDVSQTVEQGIFSNDANLLDSEVLHELSVEAGMEDISPLIRIFVDELTRCQSAIVQAIENQALDALAHEVHTLKSTAATFGAKPLQSQAIETNEYCKKNDLPMALRSARRLLPCLEATVIELKVRIA